MAMNIMIKGGWRFNRKDYSPPVMKYLTNQIENRRHFVEIGKGAEKGPRFKDTSGIVARVISNYSEEQFMADPILTVDAMLVDAARSDWWYSNEKDYLDERQDSDGYEENDDE